MTRQVRQLLIGLIALPLSLLPFWAYMTYTPEGRLVRDKALVAVNPPSLPHVSAAAIRRGVVPDYSGAVMALVYHGIGTTSDAEGGFVVSPKLFGEHLVALRKAGMHTVTAAQVAAAFAGGKPLPSRAVMISFDDGRSDAVMYADPLLKQAHMTATMFVITSRASGHGIYYADWGRLEQAAQSGRWDLESHTDSLHFMQHVNGTDLPALTSVHKGESVAAYTRRVRADFGRADHALAQHTGNKPVALAYPFGAYGADRTNDRHIRAALHTEVARHYAIAFQQDGQDTIPLATPYDERTELRRLEVGDWSSKQLMQRISAAAARTTDSLTARESTLQQRADTGGDLPPGIVEQPAPTKTHRVASASAPLATASPTPTAVAAAPADGDAPSQPVTTWPTSPPPTSPPPTQPPTTSPPTTAAPPPSGSPSSPGNSGGAPGHSTDPPGNHGKP